MSIHRMDDSEDGLVSSTLGERPNPQRCESMLVGEVRCCGIRGHLGKHSCPCPTGLIEWEGE